MHLKKNKMVLCIKKMMYMYFIVTGNDFVSRGW